jgi:hypothetical protein
MCTASAAMLEALQEAGVPYIFATFGSDHAALIEAIAKARSPGSAARRRSWPSSRRPAKVAGQVLPSQSAPPSLMRSSGGSA